MIPSKHDKAVHRITLPIISKHQEAHNALVSAIKAVALSKVRARTVGNKCEGSSILARDIVECIDTQGQFAENRVYGAINAVLGQTMLNDKDAPVRWYSLIKEKKLLAQINNLIYYRGELMLSADAAKLEANVLGIPARTIYNRCIVLNWTLERALSTPLRGGGRKPYKSVEPIATVAAEQAKIAEDLIEPAKPEVLHELSEFDKQWILKRANKALGVASEDTNDE